MRAGTGSAVIAPSIGHNDWPAAFRVVPLSCAATGSAPNAVAIASVIAYVADGTGGLQIVNYVPFDNQGNAPTATLCTGGHRTSCSNWTP